MKVSRACTADGYWSKRVSLLEMDWVDWLLLSWMMMGYRWMERDPWELFIWLWVHKIWFTDCHPHHQQRGTIMKWCYSYPPTNCNSTKEKVYMPFPFQNPMHPMPTVLKLNSWALFVTIPHRANRLKFTVMSIRCHVLLYRLLVRFLLRRHRLHLLLLWAGFRVGLLRFPSLLR